MGRKPIFYLSCNQWDSIKQREQHLCEGLSQTYDVYYIEMAGGSRRSLSGWLRCPRYSEKQVNEHLRVISLPNLLPPGFLYKHSLLRTYGDLYLSLAVRLIIHRHTRDTNYIVGVGHPRYPIALLSASLIYYDCMDDFSEFDPTNSSWMINRYKEIARHADIIIASSRELAQLFPNRNDIAIINNGVNIADFQLPVSIRPYDLPCKWPLVGYYGMISNWFDVDSVIEAARRRPRYTFVIIGPSGDAETLTRLMSISNIIYLGEKPYHELKNYLAFFDVALIPFKINNLTRYVNPTKVYEYLAMGKPVIASPLPPLSELNNQIRYYTNGEELVNAIDDFLRNPPDVHELKRAAELNTWSKRLEQLGCLLDRK